jgi:hypothetical protein
LFSLYAVLGLSEGASDQEIEQACSNLKRKLQSQEIQSDERRKKQAEKCLTSIENARKTLTNKKLKSRYLQEQQLPPEEAENTHPRIGQLCVASGMITMEQLSEAVDAQVDFGMQLGEILQYKQFISQVQLEGLLLGQQITDMPSAVIDPEALRLVSLGIITEDAALLAQMEKRTQGVTIKDVVGRHGWVDLLILDAVLP